MKTKSYILIIFFLLFLRSNIFSQIHNVNDNIENTNLNDLRKQDSIQRIRNDSLRKDFYSQPPFLTLSLEINREQVQLSNNFEFWIEKNGKQYIPTQIETNKFLLNSELDTMSIVFIYEQDSLRFENIKHRYITNGANLRFGLIENLEQIRSYYNRLKKDEDFDEWTELGEPYLGLLKDKQNKKQKRKIGKIYFLGLYPRYYGDGINIMIVNIKAK